MGNLIGSFFGSATNKSADETIAVTSISGSAGAALAYLSATLEATTPEVRRLYSEYCTQSVLAQEVLTGLSLKKGWITPYDAPLTQLGHSVQQSHAVLDKQNA